MCPRIGVVTRRADDLKANRDVFNCRLPRKQCIRLKQVPCLTVQRSKRAAKNIDRTGGWRKQASGDVQKRGFAASCGTDNCYEFAIGEVQSSVFNGRIDPSARKAESDTYTIERDRRARWVGLLRTGRNHGGAIRHCVSSPHVSWTASYPASRGLQGLRR